MTIKSKNDNNVVSIYSVCKYKTCDNNTQKVGRRNCEYTAVRFFSYMWSSMLLFEIRLRLIKDVYCNPQGKDWQTMPVGKSAPMLFFVQLTS